MLMAHRTCDAATIAATARVVVITDFIFAASEVIAEPLTSAALAWSIGYPLSERWIVLSLALYALVGLCWLPVIFIQIRMRDIAAAADEWRRGGGSAFPPRDFSLLRIWFVPGWPAFFGVVAISASMIWKPQLG
jgi:uncharacterized membrane protein